MYFFVWVCKSIDFQTNLMAHEKDLSWVPYHCTAPVTVLQACKIHSKHCSKRCNICIIEKSEEPVKGIKARTTAKIVAFLSLRVGLKRVIISYTIILHNTAKTPFTDRRMAVVQTSENDDAACTINMLGNKEATWTSER